ncbi:unnamed protein product [Somion occarium]|uniref:XPG-I domain-containing protein n=1 Tax=Somion occarium TaxID=3059160 RepID=A0ABP1CI06_9APHY
MGVQGLWDVIAKAGHSRSLTHMAVVDGFERNESGRRALRVGIDASLWYEHARFSKGGENPELRMLFFRIRSLLELPIIPLFVFDGRERPRVKRGSKLGKSGSHNLTAKLKELLGIYGIEWRMARGEAEAELAFLNRVGVIDAIMTDDVDALMFGAKTIIRNVSLTLSGNKSAPALDCEGKASKHHVKVYNAEDIRTNLNVALTKGGMFLFALLSGGDYGNGIRGCGPQIAHGLARCGFGDRLIQAYEDMGPRGIQAFLPQWRTEISNELHTNSSGLLPHRCPSIVLPDDFPDLKILVNYAYPICSETAGSRGGVLLDKGDLSIPRLAGFCEAHFDEWGHRSRIIERFRDLLWKASLMRVLRRAAMEADEKEKEKRIRAGRHDTIIRGVLNPAVDEAVGTPASLIKRCLDPVQEDLLASAFVNRGSQAGPSRSANIPDPHPLITKIVSVRENKATDKLLEYRIEIDPKQFVDLAHAGIKGKHPEPETTPELKKARPESLATMRVWVPASMMQQVHPALVQEYLAEKTNKGTRGNERRKRASRADEDGGEEDDEVEPAMPPAMPKPTRKRAPAQSAIPAVDAAENVLMEQPVASSSRDLQPAPSRRIIEIPWNSPSSLPMWNSGFFFTFPNPDNPDFLAWDEDEEDAALTPSGSSQPYQPLANVTTASAGSRTNSPSSSTSASVPRRPSHHPTESEDTGPCHRAFEDPNDAELSDSEPKTFSDLFIDSILDGTARKRKGKAKASKPRERGRKSLLDDLDDVVDQHQTSTKRRKTSQQTQSAQPSQPSSSVRGNNRIASFPELPPLDDPNMRQIREPRGAWDPWSINNGAFQNRDEENFDMNFTRGRNSQASGSKGFARVLPRRRTFVPPTSSQESGLASDDFLGDVDTIIDLT